MPLLWKILIIRYLRTNCLCILSLIFVTIISSLQELVSFITKDVPYTTVLKLASYQIPYLLPFIIPVACFISAFTLFRSLSGNNQLVFLQASGASRSIVIFPLLITSVIISCFNFYSCSELASFCRFQTCKEIAHMAVSSPSLLLQSIQKNGDNHVFISVDQCVKNTFDNVIIAFKQNNELSQIGLISQVIPDTQHDSLYAKDIVFLSKANAFTPNPRKEIYIETAAEATISKISSTLLSGKTQTKTRSDYLPWKQLIKDSLDQNQVCNYFPEIIRRCSIGFLCITLTYVGIVLGTFTPRFPKKHKSLFLFPILTLTLLIIGKNAKHISSAIYLFVCPQLLCWIIFSTAARKDRRGST